ncbi:hypothetical protein B0T19DRAFT_151123 [Cercophora scortea]|uniref:Rhodopsin domain-containing protein n=1 Tax=Cercophora scortea TaxID=314031 RepID=A0AAE0ILA6_9PEZI|nr:hypothetical protein B0T19DRAFT_151123 [Cercophora scortea]
MLRHAPRAVDLIPSADDLTHYDFSDKSTLAPAIWQVNLTFSVVIGVVVTLRVFTRAFLTRHFFIDDILIVFAALFTLVSATTALVATRYGLGMHVWNLPPPLDNMMDMLKHCVQLMYVAHVFYAAATAFTKLSIITSYLRIFPHRLLRRILLGTAVMVTGLGLGAIFATIFQCTPVRAAWDFTITDSRCFPFIDFLYGTAAVNIVTDFILVTAPLPYFWSLNLPIKQRLLICLLFGVGFIAFIASVIRIVTLRDMYGIDVTYYLVSPLNWTIIECSLCIVCVSVPPMRPLLAKIFPHSVSNFITRMTAVKTATHRAANNKHSGHQLSQLRTHREMIEDMENDMDRQLSLFESSKSREKESGSGKGGKGTVHVITKTVDVTVTSTSKMSLDGESVVGLTAPEEVYLGRGHSL